MNRYDSRTWTGLYAPPYQFRMMRYSQRLHHRIAVYLGMGIRKAAHSLFQHSWSWSSDCCEVCHLTREEWHDHSWRYFPRGVAVLA